MSTRIYSLFVLAAWLISMSWLFVAKIWPTLHGGDPPDYSVKLAHSLEKSPPVAWRIVWKDRRIGTAASQTLPAMHGIKMRFVVQFEKLPLEMMLSEAFGTFGSIFLREPAGKSGSGQADKDSIEDPDSQAIGLDLLLATELQFDDHRRFTGFQCIADMGTIRDLLKIQGEVDERQKLVVTTRLTAPFGSGPKHLTNELDLPSNALVSDSFAPRSELKRLHVGQKWTVPVYRPFPPNSPVQIIAAHAERHELILWDNGDVETILVVYRSDAGVGLNTGREPIAREWVRADGLVLQQEVRWSGTVIRFERVPPNHQEPVEELLSSESHARLWPRGPVANVIQK